MTKAMVPRVGVVGAGSAGLAALNEIFRAWEGTDLPDVVLIEGGSRDGAGSVFRDDLDCALVNRQARHMSMDLDRPDDFLEWLDGHPAAPDGVDGEYWTRRFFGTYLEQRFAEVLDRWAEAGAPVQRVIGYATSVEETAAGVLVRVGQEVVEVDHLVLCTGHGRQDRAPAGPADLLRPYPLRELVEQTHGLTRVAVIGAGLTAVDCALALTGADPDRVVSMFSRTGILPDVRADHAEDLPLHHPPREHAEGATLGELKRVFRLELAAHGVSEKDLRRYLARLEAGVTAFVESAPVPQAERTIQNIAISLANRDLPTYWFGFSEEDRTTLLRRHYRILQAVCSPIPPRTARLLREALAEGRIEVLRGTAERTADGWRVAGPSGTLSFDAVVDGTGESTSSGQEEFERALVAEGGPLADDHGGLAVTRPDGRLLRADGRPSRVHALGFVTRGSLLYSSSLHQATRNAQPMAAHLREALGPVLREAAVAVRGA